MIPNKGREESLLVDSAGGVFLYNDTTGALSLLARYTLPFTDIALTPDGRVFAVDLETLYELDLDTDTYTLVTGLNHAPNALGADENGNLYIGLDGRNAILVYDIATGSFGPEIALPAGIRSAGDIHVDDGLLYYATADARLLTINAATGAVTVNVAHGIDGLFGLSAFNGVLTAHSGNTLYDLNPDTGAVSVVGSLTGSIVIQGAASPAATGFSGTAGDDTITLSFGGSTVSGLGGNDRILGSSGADRMIGGAGNDTLTGNGGSDRFEGGADADFVYGDVLPVNGAGAAAGQVYRLYQATLDRAPDATGYQGWTERLFEGARTLPEVAQGFVGSAEFQATYGALGNTAFVTLLYQNVLDRAPDAGGLAGWLAQLDGGASRAQVVLGFSESGEFQTNTRAAAAAAAEAASAPAWQDDVFRLYQATLDRVPDLGGFLGWTGLLAGGRDYLSVVNGFVASAEFQATYGALDNTAFVTLLYQNVLDRAPDSGGLAGWLAQLDGGASRAQVVRGFAQSAEFVADTTAPLEAWIRGLGTDDTLNGGSGANSLAGGVLADVFVFAPAYGGTHDVLDLEPWDVIDLDAFAYANAAAARSHMTQSGDDVVFADQGVSVTFEGTTLAQIADDMLLL